MSKKYTGEVLLPPELDVWKGSWQDLPYKITLLIIG